MGAMQNNQGKSKGKRSHRGSVNNKRRLDAFASKDITGRASWGECSSDILLGVVGQITDMGGAITISLSRDKGAHSLTLMLDDERETLWFNREADLDMELGLVAAKLASMD